MGKSTSFSEYIPMIVAACIAGVLGPVVFFGGFIACISVLPIFVAPGDIGIGMRMMAAAFFATVFAAAPAAFLAKRGPPQVSMFGLLALAMFIPLALFLVTIARGAGIEKQLEFIVAVIVGWVLVALVGALCGGIARCLTRGNAEETQGPSNPVPMDPSADESQCR